MKNMSNICFYKMFLKNVFCQKLVKNDAGEAREPFRQMRLEKRRRVQGLTSRGDEFYVIL